MRWAIIALFVVIGFQSLGFAETDLATLKALRRFILRKLSTAGLRNAEEIIPESCDGSEADIFCSPATPLAGHGDRVVILDAHWKRPPAMVKWIRDTQITADWPLFVYPDFAATQNAMADGRSHPDK